MQCHDSTNVPECLQRDELRLSADQPSSVWLPNLIFALCLAMLFTVYFARVNSKPATLMNYISFSSSRLAEDGFLKHRFTVPFPDRWSDYNAMDYTVWYTHYPPLPYYLGALVWMAGGISKAAMTMCFDVVALGYVLLFYRILSLLLNRWIACLAALTLAVHMLFVRQVLENYLNLSLFFQAAAFLLLILALESTSKGRRYLLYVGTWVCLFGDAYSTYDQTLASGFIVFAYTFWRLGLSQWRRAALSVGAMATASISAFLLHLLTNAWFFGSFQQAFQDLCVNALQDKSVREVPFQETINLSDYPRWLLSEVWSDYGLTLWGSAAVAVSVLWAFLSWRKTLLVHRYIVLVGIIWVANMTYWTVFARLNFFQWHTANAAQWLPTYSILLGGAVYFMAVKIRANWKERGIGKLSVVAAELLFLLSLNQIGLHSLQGVEYLHQNLPARFKSDFYNSTTTSFLDLLCDKVPSGAVVAFSGKMALRDIGRTRPRSAFGLNEFPFSLIYLKPQDKNALYMMESKALSKKVYVVGPSPATLTEERQKQWRETMVSFLIRENVPKEFWDQQIAMFRPMPIRPNWELVFEKDELALYQVHTPEKDDLFPERTSLPTRMAISGLRIRDGNELQIVGWLFTGERASRVLITLDGRPLGEATYPCPDAELAAANFSGARRWYGMHDYPLPPEELPGVYPEYKNDMSRFIFLSRQHEISPGTHKIGVQAFSGERLIGEAVYDMDDSDGQMKIRQFFAFEKAPAASS